MKLLFYYMKVLLPALLFIALYQMDFKIVFIISILIYALIYRPFVDGYRLISLGLIQKENFYKLFIPFYRSKYFYELHFKVWKIFNNRQIIGHEHILA